MATAREHGCGLGQTPQGMGCSLRSRPRSQAAAPPGADRVVLVLLRVQRQDRWERFVDVEPGGDHRARDVNAEGAPHPPSALVEPPPGRAGDLSAPTGLVIEPLDVDGVQEPCVPRVASGVASRPSERPRIDELRQWIKAMAPCSARFPCKPRCSGDGRYWARTSDLRLVEAALSQLS
jgi:hypothetical protein